MALRMVDDPQDQQDYNENNDSGNERRMPGGGGGAGLLNFIPLIFSLFRGGGKGSILLIILIAAGFFLMRNGSCNQVSQAISQFTTGGRLDPNQFKKASVYEGLEDDAQKNPLPERVSLRRFAPERRNQGQQGSCVAWSSAYAARSIVESASTDARPNEVAFSPSFLYNQIGLDGCQGSYIIRAMEFMTTKGAVPYNAFPYDDQDCSRQPNSNLMDAASQYKMHGFNRLTEDDGVSKISFRAIKEHLAKDAPVVIGMMVGGSFMQDMMGKNVWHPTDEDYNMMGFGGHAMCVIGYDDQLEGGAFEIMNSWGPEWGQQGVAFVRYGDFRKFVREAYGIDPMPKRGAALDREFAGTVALVNNQTRQYIPLQSSGSQLFRTVNPVSKGTRFKIEIRNELECYIYLFTPPDGKNSEVLFPYKPVHSPYCGITGTRLFPRKESVEVDAVGNADYMAVLISKRPVDYQALNQSINQQTGSDFPTRFRQAIRSMQVANPEFKASSEGAIQYRANAREDHDWLGSVVEIQKQ